MPRLTQVGVTQSAVYIPLAARLRDVLPVDGYSKLGSGWGTGRRLIVEVEYIEHRQLQWTLVGRVSRMADVKARGNVSFINDVRFISILNASTVFHSVDSRL